MIASSRSLARAISAALARPSASSISTSSPMRLVRPSLVSSWVSSTSTHHTSRAVRALGTMSTSSASRAPVTTSMMSPWHQGVSSPLTRTARTVRPQSCPVSAATAMARRPPWRAARRRPRGRGTRGRRRTPRPSRTCSRCWPAWPAPIVGRGVRARSPPAGLGWVAQMTPAARAPRGGRRRGPAGRRRPRRCRRRAPARGGRRAPVSRSSARPGACTLIGPEVGVVDWTKVPRARRCSSASSCSAS